MKHNFYSSPNALLLLGMLLFLTSSILAQKTINNQLTDQHLLIAGTRVSVVPPPGFEPATTFLGLYHARAASSIMVTELPGPYLEVSKGFRSGNMGKAGMELVSRKEVTVQGLDGILLEVDQFKDGTTYEKLILIFGDESHSVFLNAVCPKGQTKNISKAMQESVLSMVYQPDLKVDPLETLPFTMGSEGTGFDSSRVIMGALMFTREGGTPPRSVDKAVIFAVVTSDKSEISDKRAAAVEAFKHSGGGNHDVYVDSIAEVTIDGLQGYEIVGSGVDNKSGVRELMFQVLLYGYQRTTLIMGTAASDYDKNVEAFRKISRTLRHK